MQGWNSMYFLFLIFRNTCKFAQVPRLDLSSLQHLPDLFLACLEVTSFAQKCYKLSFIRFFKKVYAVGL